MAEFAHLHLHTEYSLLDGLGRIDDYMQRATEFGMSHVAITDHGVMYGVLDWYKSAKQHGLSPIVGVEAYMARNGMRDREDRRPYHVVLLAENERGYRNLLQLASRASLEGFYYRPRIDLDLLADHSEGVLATSACLQGPLASHLLHGEDDQAETLAKRFLEIFGPERFFIEVQDHGIPEQRQVLPKLVELAHKLDVQLVAANDVHYLEQRDAEMQDLLIAIQTNRSLNDPQRLKMSTDQLYFKSPDEMARLFHELPEAVTNTMRVAERCAFELEFGRLHLPDPDLPPGKSPQEHLSDLCWAGLPARFPELTEEVRRRLEYELWVIEQTGFPSYMLIVRDFALFARDRNIPFGVRGSAAASLVLYTLGITDIDPLANRLVFERFLNIERREMPDIDMDFADNRRGEVIDYVANKYGHDRVAQIITFGTMGAKAAVRDVGRALGWSHGDADRVARAIPAVLNMNLERALEESSELRSMYDEDPQVTDLIDRARRLEGIARHAGTHAAGIVISRDPLVQHLPLQRPPRGDDELQVLPTTQFPMETVAEIGLLKMDFLGLSNLTILGEAVEIVKQSRGELLDTKLLPDHDAATYAMLGKGETFGVFQLESAGMRRGIQDLRPGTIGELAAMVALYRPGPMQHIPRFCRAKHGDEEIAYPHPDLSDILDETYGVIVYQDQVLLIAQKFAGYTLGEADIMRKAMGKKIPEKMKAERERFIQGAVERGYSADDAITIFDLIEPFAGYAFNKAHAVCYGTISYQTAFLKANYPAEYMTAVMRLAPSHPSGPAARVAAAAAECAKLNIPVLPPDVNRSQVQFQVELLPDGNRAIRFGLSIIKNVGEAAVEALVAARMEQPHQRFESLYELCAAVDARLLNKRVLESLIKAGACDGFGSRALLLASLDRVLSAAQAQQRAVSRGQMDLFGGQMTAVSAAHELEDAPQIAKKTLMAWEKEHVGFYLTENPLTDVHSAMGRAGQSFMSVADLDAELAGRNVRMVALVAEVRRITTRTQRLMAVAKLEDLTGNIEAVLFPQAFEQFGSLLDENAVLAVTGKVDIRNDEIQLLVDEIRLVDDIEPAPAPAGQTIFVRLSEPAAGNADRMYELAQLLREFPGDDELVLILELHEQERAFRLGLRVDWGAHLAAAVNDLLDVGGGLPEPSGGRDEVVSVTPSRAA